LGTRDEKYSFDAPSGWLPFWRIFKKGKNIRSTSSGNVENYTKIPGDKRRVYDISITEEMIDDDKHAKFIIDRSDTETVKRKINFGKYTTYDYGIYSKTPIMSQTVKEEEDLRIIWIKWDMTEMKILSYS